MDNYENDQRRFSRRRALALIGGGTAALTLAGCGGEEPPKPELTPPAPKPKPSPAAAKPAEAETPDKPPQQEMAAESPDSSGADAGAMPKIDPSSAQAKQLAYVNDASTLSAGPDSRYAAGQKCANCALYQGGDAEWGGCPLFQGRQVKATGWCSAYSPSA